MRKIGFIGLGNIGGGICHNLILAGNQLTVFDIDNKAMQRFHGRACLANNVLDVLGKSDIIFFSLPNSNIVESVMEQFFAAGVHGKTIIDMSTSFPLSTKKLNQRAKEQGCLFLDAPLMAGPSEAEAGEAEIVIGGDRTEVEKLDDLFRSFCKTYSYAGESGNGHLMKLALNFCGLTEALIYAQIFPVMAKMGFDPKEFYKILNVEGRTTWVLNFYGKKFVERDYHLDFALALGTKDLAYMKRLYEELNIPAFLLDGALDLCRMTLAGQKQGETLDFSAPAETLYEMLGIPKSQSENADE